MSGMSLISQIDHYIQNESWKNVPTGKEYRQHDPCAYCGYSSDTWDHLDSKSSIQFPSTAYKRNKKIQYGRRNPSNLVRACLKCNQEKSAATVLMFLTGRKQNVPRGSRGYFSPKFKLMLITVTGNG